MIPFHCPRCDKTECLPNDFRIHIAETKAKYGEKNKSNICFRCELEVEREKDRKMWAEFDKRSKSILRLGKVAIVLGIIFNIWLQFRGQNG